jgi:hypothetical protein
MVKPHYVSKHKPQLHKVLLNKGKNGNFQGHNSLTKGSNKSSKVGQFIINFSSIFMNFGDMGN